MTLNLLDIAPIGAASQRAFFSKDSEINLLNKFSLKTAYFFFNAPLSLTSRLSIFLTSGEVRFILSM